MTFTHAWHNCPWSRSLRYAATSYDADDVTLPTGALTAHSGCGR